VIQYALTRRAVVHLLIRCPELTFTRDTCPVCGGPNAVWPDRIVCMSRPGGLRCTGNGPRFPGADR
jgi:hypothetical protein